MKVNPTTLVKGTLNLMMWLKTKTTLLICAIALTAAGGIDIVIKNFDHTPGGAQTLDALEALKSLRMKNQLPGYVLSTNVGSGFMIPGLLYAKDTKTWQMTGTNLDNYPVSRTFQFFTNAATGFIWHYTVVKTSESTSWHMEKAWQTDHEGKLVAEFPVPGQ